MVAPVFRESVFVLVCVALMGGCALAALAAWQGKFLLGLSERFVKLPPSTKAVIVTAVVIATVSAQKPENVATNLHESARISIRENSCQFVDETTQGGRLRRLTRRILRNGGTERGWKFQTGLKVMGQKQIRQIL